MLRADQPQRNRFEPFEGVVSNHRFELDVLGDGPVDLVDDDEVSGLKRRN